MQKNFNNVIIIYNSYSLSSSSAFIYPLFGKQKNLYSILTHIIEIPNNDYKEKKIPPIRYQPIPTLGGSGAFNNNNNNNNSDDDNDSPLSQLNLKQLKKKEQNLLILITEIKGRVNNKLLNSENKILALNELAEADEYYKNILYCMDKHYLKAKMYAKNILAKVIEYNLDPEQKKECMNYLISINLALNYVLNEIKRLNSELFKIKKNISELKYKEKKNSENDIKLVSEEKNFTGNLYNKKKLTKEYADNYEAERDFKLNIHKKNIYATPYFQDKKRRNKFNFNKSKKEEPSWKNKIKKKA